jgi:tetratricopeptide (TPR) repeat protein
MGAGISELVAESTEWARAAALEAEAGAFPEQRGMLLLEAARAWRAAGEAARATALLDEQVARGGDDGCYARVQRAEFWAEDADWARAEAELVGLAHQPDLHDGHCTLVAELLVERDRLPEAARWYDRGVARLTLDTLEALAGPGAWTRLGAVMMLRGRRELRARLGQEMDATDELVADLARRDEIDDLGPAPDLDAVTEHLASGGAPPQTLRLLTFQRDQRALAQHRWPRTYPDSDECYYPAAERRWRELAAHGVPDMQVVPVSVAGLVAFAERLGADPTDPAVKTRYIHTVPAEEVIAWPPPRNERCWCGSQTKYKKCCGRPH